MKYASMPAVNEPVYDEDHMIVVGFKLCYTVTCKGKTASATADYSIPEDEQFPVAEIIEKGSAAVWQGMLRNDLVAKAEANLDQMLENANV